MNAIASFSCHAGDLPRTDEVLSLLLPRLVPVSKTETISLAAALGRVLAEDAQAALDAPPCDRSAMDGYAFRFGEAGPLRLAGHAPAGKPFTGVVRQGECIAVATGGAIPKHCDTVAMREDCEVTRNGVAVSARGQGANVRRQGEDFRMGDTLLQSGTHIGARQIALLAAAGLETVTVAARLRVALISMGDELAEAAPDSIRDANRPMLRALCVSNGFDVTDFGILPDNREQLAKVLARAAADHDVVITTAGTSAGDEDHARGAIVDCGGRLFVSGAAIKPGKPVSFGQIGPMHCIALPGNPAAAYIVFLALGLPLLHRLSGRIAPPAPWHSVQAGFAHRNKCDALLVDTVSRSDTYPYVDIREDDVEMGHEASVSKISEDQLFYLMSRGMTEDEAAATVVRGFVEPIARELPMEYALELNRLIELQMQGAVG